jgi:DnaK suppressor protein
MAMSRIETEAQRLLLERRESLWRPPVAPPAAPAPSRTDREAAPEPLSEERRQELEAIDEALRRIAEGRYGNCLACGGPLGLQRIRAIPEARYCLSCSGSRSAAG